MEEPVVSSVSLKMIACISRILKGISTYFGQYLLTWRRRSFWSGNVQGMNTGIVSAKLSISLTPSVVARSQVFREAHFFFSDSTALHSSAPFLNLWFLATLLLLHWSQRKCIPSASTNLCERWDFTKRMAFSLENRIAGETEYFGLR